MVPQPGSRLFSEENKNAKGGTKSKGLKEIERKESIVAKQKKAANEVDAKKVQAFKASGACADAPGATWAAHS